MSKEIDPHIQEQLSVLQTCKDNWWRNNSFSANVLKQLDIPMSKEREKNESESHISHYI